MEIYERIAKTIYEAFNHEEWDEESEPRQALFIGLARDIMDIPEIKDGLRMQGIA